MIHLSPQWNWKGHEGKVIPVMAYTNCDSVEFGAMSPERVRQLARRGGMAS